IGMIITPLPAHQRKRKFQLFHGELMEEDDFDDEDAAEDEEFVIIDDEESTAPAAEEPAIDEPVAEEAPKA
ncbi:MAG: hypothetical protein WCH40_02600, partial [Verrucomicrobiales bacterium]